MPCREGVPTKPQLLGLARFSGLTHCYSGAAYFCVPGSLRVSVCPNWPLGGADVAEPEAAVHPAALVEVAGDRQAEASATSVWRSLRASWAAAQESTNSWRGL